MFESMNVIDKPKPERRTELRGLPDKDQK